MSYTVTRTRAKAGKIVNVKTGEAHFIYDYVPWAPDMAEIEVVDNEVHLDPKSLYRVTASYYGTMYEVQEVDVFVIVNEKFCMVKHKFMLDLLDNLRTMEWMQHNCHRQEKP